METTPVTNAEWADRRLPTEAEWERAARGGLEGKRFVWGDEHVPDGQLLANTWQGEFSHENTRFDGYERTSPVGAFPANDSGLSDAAGNVWEWTSDWFSADPTAGDPPTCCTPTDPRGVSEEQSVDPHDPSQSPGTCSRAARTCVRRTTVSGIDRRRATPNRSMCGPSGRD